MALNLDTDGFRRAGELVDTAGQVLGGDFDDDVPPCGTDEVSRTVMDNLNARRRWLMQHVRAGVVQTSDAAAGINQTATGYEAEDTHGASLYGAAGGHGGGAAPAVMASAPSSGGSAPPAGMPAVSSVPDLSGLEGEALAQALETGAGPGPAAAAAARLVGLASQAAAANVTLVGAHTQLMASGESGAHPGLETKLTRGIAWTEAVSGHATALAGDYEAAGALHTTTLAEVGPSATWRTLKTGYQASVEKNYALAGMAQAEVDAWQQALEQQEQRKGTAMTGYQTGGETLSAPPGHLPDPGLDPNGESEESKKSDKSDKKSSDDAEDPASGMGSMLEPVMGAVGPLMQSLGKANPLQSLGQLGQQLGQQVGKMSAEAAKKAASPPLKPAALAKPNAAAGKGGGGGGKGGGGGSSPIKPVSSLGGATSLSGTPPSSPSATPIKPAAAAAGSTSTSGSGGMGMMPMGRGAGGDAKTSKINSYEQPLPEVDDAGRPGVEGQSGRPAEPVVNPEAQNAVKERIARRKKDTAADGDA